jgi:hypothetical protein
MMRVSLAEFSPLTIFFLALLLHCSQCITCGTGDCNLRAVNCSSTIGRPFCIPSSFASVDIVPNASAAHDMCKAMPGGSLFDLVLPRSSEVNQLVFQLCPSAAFFPVSLRNELGCFKFVEQDTNMLLSFAPWSVGQPNDGNMRRVDCRGTAGEEQCIAFNESDGGTWRDRACQASPSSPDDLHTCVVCGARMTSISLPKATGTLPGEPSEENITTTTVPPGQPTPFPTPIPTFPTPGAPTTTTVTTTTTTTTRAVTTLIPTPLPTPSTTAALTSWSPSTSTTSGVLGTTSTTRIVPPLTTTTTTATTRMPTFSSGPTSTTPVPTGAGTTTTTTTFATPVSTTIQQSSSTGSDVGSSGTDSNQNSTDPATLVSSSGPNANSSSTNLISDSTATEIGAMTSFIGVASDDATLAIAIGASVGALFLLLLIIIVVVLFRRRRRNQGVAKSDSDGAIMQPMAPSEGDSLSRPVPSHAASEYGRAPPMANSDYDQVVAGSNISPAGNGYGLAPPPALSPSGDYFRPPAQISANSYAQVQVNN